MKNWILIVTAIVLCSNIMAQENEDKGTASQEGIKPYYGLTFGLGFGDYTNVSITPLIGFPVTPKLSLGARAGYEYIKDKRTSPSTTWNNYGASVFTRYKFIPRAYGHAEFAYYNYSINNSFSSGDSWVPFLYVGGGYVQAISPTTSFVIEVLFDVLQDDFSPYNPWQPMITIGVQMGF